jgi:hypothetical protein
MSSGTDPTADYMTAMGLQGLYGQNPYLTYQGQIPMAGFTGNPTNAMGQVIPSWLQAQQQAAAPAAAPSTPGTTLNSTPGAGTQAYQMNPQTGQMAPNPAAFSAGNFAGGVNPATGQTLMQAQAAANNYYNPQPATLVGGQQEGMYGSGGGQTVGGTYMTPSPASMAAPWANQQPTQVQPQASGPNMRQAYLNALANPGNPAMPGAAAPGAGQTLTGSAAPNVLAQFLASQQGKTGAGGYSNQGFFNTLRGLQAQQPATGATP